MSVQRDSPAVAVARAHAEAWSNHDWDAARESLAADVHVTATTTQPFMTATDLTGIEDYMRGLEEFAGAVVPGTARVVASVGDEKTRTSGSSSLRSRSEVRTVGEGALRAPPRPPLPRS